ncbi:hypothetical protein CRG98_030424, partial [Punica granatum]
MERSCDFCRAANAVVYCNSDSARLCLHCDGYIHSANSLASRHSRWFLCNRCSSQPAIVRCLDEKLSLCQSCDWNGLEMGCSGLGHSRRALEIYTGCPSLADELGEGWGPSDELSCVFENKGTVSFYGTMGRNAFHKQDPWSGHSTGFTSNNHYVLFCKGEAPSACLDPNPSKVPFCCSEHFKNPGNEDSGAGLVPNLDMDDFPQMGNSKDVLDCETDEVLYQFTDEELECLLMEKNGPTDNAIEASSSVQPECASFQPARIGNLILGMQGVKGSSSTTDNCMLTNPPYSSIGMGFPTPSMSLPLHNITGESHAIEYQDSGISPMLLSVKSPWDPKPEGSCPQ